MAKAERKLNVGAVNTEKAAQTQQEIINGDRQFWKIAEGDNRVRIMPPPADHEDYFYKTGTHYSIGPDDKSFACPKVSGARATCFLCETHDRLQRSDDEDDQAEAKELRVSKKYLMTIMDTRKPEAGFQIWSAGVKAFRDVNYYFSDPEWGDVSNLLEGFDFIVTRKGQNLNTEYSVKIARKPSDFTKFLEDHIDNYEDAMFDDLPILEEFQTYASDAEMKAVYNGTSTGTTTKTKKKPGEDEDDEDEEALPKSKRNKASPSFPDEDDDDEDDTPPPTRTKAKGKKKPEPEPEPEDDDDDDEDEDEEEEPEEAPAPTRRSGRTSGRTAARLKKGLREGK